jgi:bleomycin hydrolase
MLGEVYRMLTICRAPPKTFDFEYRDNDKNFHRDCGLTPVEFLQKVRGPGT